MKKSLILVIFGLFVLPVLADSQYAGSNIDNVQSYSSSPFYQTGGAYNQTMPAPVYVKGPSIGAAECATAIQSAIWTQCVLRRNCLSLSATDIIPGIATDLARRTDNNYTVCNGYIEPVFLSFKQQYGATVTPTGFPTGTAPANYNNGGNGTLQNPFTYENQVPYYKQQQDARQYQLEAVQQQTTPKPTLAAAPMPATVSDLSFEERNAIAAEGFQNPAVGQYDTYGGVKVETSSEALQRQGQDMSEQRSYETNLKEYRRTTMTKPEFCATYPEDPSCVTPR